MLFGRNFARPPVGSHGNIGETRFGHFDADHVGRIALSVYDDVDGDRGPPDPHDLGIKAHHVADQDRLLEHERVHGDRGDPPARALRGEDAAGDVDLRHHPATENVAVLIGVRRHRNHAQRRGLIGKVYAFDHGLQRKESQQEPEPRRTRRSRRKAMQFITRVQRDASPCSPCSPWSPWFKICSQVAHAAFFASSRNSRRRILPTFVLGRSLRNSISRGHLYPVRCSRQCFITSAAVSAGSFLTTKRFTASPDFASGTPTAAHSRTPGCMTTTASISFGYTLKPDTRIMSFLRSTIRMKPRSSITPMSPVASHPSLSSTFTVSSGRFQ